MTDDTNGETTDEPTDDWPRPWAEITRTDADAEVNTGGDVRLASIDPGRPMVDFGHGLRAYDGTVYMRAGEATDDAPALWEPLRVHVHRLVDEALEDRTIDPSELVDRAIAREMHRRDMDALSRQGDRQ